MFGNISASLIFGTSNAQVVGSSPTRSSRVLERSDTVRRATHKIAHAERGTR